ncbi:MAG: prepilin-type N-terminal cleavage/methylation domain-containing protein [Deltaproteobacteria bacterium]|nr:MAG: prepilin-type N-terminal cleavage/methylation domain-containing protein [Deltaproteobacteria bacterium]
MRLTKPLSPIRNQRGMTFVELLMVMAILVVLGSMAYGEFYQRRMEAFNKQAVSYARNLLTMVGAAFANDEIPVGLATGVSNGAVPGFDSFAGNPGTVVSLTILDGGDAADPDDDLYQFHVGTEGGDSAYYFWVPGPAHPVDQDADGLSSDTIFDNRDVIGIVGVNWRDIPLNLI